MSPAPSNRVQETLARLTLVFAGFLVSGMLVEGTLRWVLTDFFVYRNPEFIVHSVHPDDAPAHMREPLLSAGLRYVDQRWKYGLKRDLRARLVSSEFDVAFRTNSRGWRGFEVSPQKQGLRLLGLRDSFAMGFGVEQD